MSDDRPETGPAEKPADEKKADGAPEKDDAPAKKADDAPKPKSPEKDDAPAKRADDAPKPRSPEKDAGPGWLRTGGCLVALFVLLAALLVVALVYRPPRPPAAGPSGLGGDGGDAIPPDLPAIRAVALSPDGTLVAVGGEETVDGRYVIRLRRIEERKFVDREAPLREIAAHGEPVRALRFRPPDGAELFSASLDGTIGWWRVEDGTKIGALEPPGPSDEMRGLLALAVSPDGRHLAAAGWSGDVYLWDLADPGPAPTVFRAHRPPWEKDPKELEPTGHLEEVRTLTFVPGQPPLLLSGGADGQLVAWNLVTRRAGRIVAGDGKTWKVRDLLLRQVSYGRDRDFAFVALLAPESRAAVFASDYRGCVYLVAADGPCRSWWMGTELASGPTTCLRPLLDRKKYCVPFERIGEEGEAAFLGLVEFPGLVGGYVGVAWNERFRAFRANDGLPWRTFEGAARRREWMCSCDASRERGFLVAGGETGHLRLYELLGEPTAPDIRLGDQL